jgi:hypothetical protein
MTVIVGQATSNPRRAMFYLGAEGKNVERRVLHVTGLDLDRTRFTSTNKEEVRAEAAYVAAQAETFVETVPANRKARRKAAAEARRQAKRDGKPAPTKPKPRNTWYGASLNPSAGVEVRDEDFLRGRHFLIDTVFRRYDGDRRGPVQEPAQDLLVLHRKLVPVRNPLHAHYSGSLATGRGTMIPLHYDAVNTAVAGARWAADRGWPGTCSHYTVAVEHRVRTFYPEAHATVVAAMIRRAEEGQRVGAIPRDRDIHTMEPPALAQLIERRFRPRRDDADLEERIAVYRLLDGVPSTQTQTVLARAGYCLALGDAQTKRGTPIYLVQPVEREDGALRSALSLHKVARAGLQADGHYDRLGVMMGEWIDAKVAGLSPKPIREVRRELEQAATTIVPAIRPVTATVSAEPSDTSLATLRASAIRIGLPSTEGVSPYRTGRIEVDGSGFVVLPRAGAADHASLLTSDGETHETLARLVLERRQDDHAIDVTGPREGPHRVQTTIIALARQGVDPARIVQLAGWPELAARAGDAYSKGPTTEESTPGPALRAEQPSAEPADPPTHLTSTPEPLPGFRFEHLFTLETEVRGLASTGRLPAPIGDIASLLQADWQAVRRANPDAEVEAGRRAIREGVGVALVGLVRDQADAASIDDPIRAVASDAIAEVSSSARASRSRFALDAVTAYLDVRLSGLSVEDACRAAAPIERERADGAAMATALRRAVALAPSDPASAERLADLLREPTIETTAGYVAPTSPVGARPATSKVELASAETASAPDLNTEAAPSGTASAQPTPAEQAEPPTVTKKPTLATGEATNTGTTSPATNPASHPNAWRDLTPAERAKAVRALNDRETAVAQRGKRPPQRRALRLNPDITAAERQLARRILIADALDQPVTERRGPVTEALNPKRSLSGLRTIVRQTEAAQKKTTNEYEKAALACGLATAEEAYRIVSAGSRRSLEEQKIALDDQIRILDASATQVRIEAATLALNLPQLRDRVASAAKTRGSSEDMVALDGALALQRLREKNKPANETAARLEVALRGLTEAGRTAQDLGTRNGGYTKEQKLAVHSLRHRLANEAAWVPPMSDDPRTVRRRVEDSLDPGRLPTKLAPKKPDMKARLRAEQADWERRLMDQEAARISAAARADAARRETPAARKPASQRANTAAPPAR